jgi:hypothetical protein
MKKKFQKPWKVSDFINKAELIDFPEFQREPTIWNLEKKQRLIDSIIRGFDISTIYLCEGKDKKFDCIDGQQRINAIWSYLAINDKFDQEDNGFHLKISNEVYTDPKELKDLDNKRFENLDKKTKDLILDYEINIVILQDIKELDLNLQFLRLQLGAPLNAGEKLNAMSGEIRDFIFHDLKDHIFFNSINIPRRRYYKELVASQIVINAFSKIENNEFNRARFVDLQDFFLAKEKLSATDKKTLKDIKKNLDIISKYVDDNAGEVLKNRALVVSSYNFGTDLIQQSKEKLIKDFFSFLEKLRRTIKWQIPKGLEMDASYKELLSFQTNITQAAAEKTAIQSRHDFLKIYFDHYLKHKEIIGDSEYKKLHRKNPDDERKKVKL